MHIPDLNDPVTGSLHVKRRGFELGPIRIGALKNEILLILGNNGAGKTTLLQALVQAESDAGNRCAYLPQSFNLPGFSTVRQLCEFAADRRVRTRKERPRVVESAIQVVGLTDVADRKVMRLSG